MRYLLVLPLALLFLAGCAKSDRELINGTWSIQEMKADGELVYSSDKKEQDKVVDRVIKEQMAQIPAEAQAQAQGQVEMMRQMFNKQMEVVGKTTIEIKEDGTFISTRYEQDKPVQTKGKMTLDEKKKEVVMKSDSEEKFKYEVNGDMLKLSGEAGAKLELSFKRK